MDSGQYLRGIALFDRADFFECHEVLEDVWRDAPEAEKKFLQAIIQVAVAFHHYSQGNSRGARSLLERALRNLAGYPEEFGGIELTALRKSIAAWQEALAKEPSKEGLTTPPLPRLKSGIAGKVTRD
jgi:predicted metal-dependent hydrolase